MKKNLKLKPFVLPTIYILSVLTLVVSIYYTAKTLKSTEDDYNTYVSKEILGEDIPVINTKTAMITPYTDANVTIGKSFYDYKGESKDQENSIVKYNNTYMQNNGVDYVLKETFDVVSVLDGKVVDITDDETLGQTIVIEHENGIVTTYESLSKISVKKGDMVTQGQVIGASGTNKIEKELGNHLYFQVTKDNKILNPENCYNKDIKDL